VRRDAGEARSELAPALGVPLGDGRQRRRRLVGIRRDTDEAAARED
jgi:hypothetical protein